MDGVDLDDTINCCPAYFINSQIPFLSYIRIAWDDYYAQWLKITVDPEDPDARQFTSLEDSPDRSFQSEFWGDFFGSPLMSFT